MATIPTPAETATSAPAPEPPETPQEILAATTALPANSQTPEATTTPVPTLASETPTPTLAPKPASTPTTTPSTSASTPQASGATPTGAEAKPTLSLSQVQWTATSIQSHGMPGEFPVEPPVWGNDSDQVQVGSPGFRKDLFGVPLVFSPDVRSQLGSAIETAPRYGSIQRVEIALPHPDGRHGPVHGASESKYGCVARGQLTVVFNLEVQDRQVLLPGPCLWRHANVLPLNPWTRLQTGVRVPAVTYTETRVSADPGPAQPLVRNPGGHPPAAREDVHLLHELVLERTPL